MEEKYFSRTHAAGPSGSIKKEMDDIYRDMALEEIPWNIKETPQFLIDLTESKKILPCRALDVGCGTGNQAVFFAKKGFEVTGVDISPEAIKIAKKNAKEHKVLCDFIVLDAVRELSKLKKKFDFVYDWEFLHHIFPQEREQYIKGLVEKIRPGGTYLSVCFSEKDPHFGGRGKIRRTRIGTVLIFSSLQELRLLFEPFFVIKDIKKIKVMGKTGSHIANYVLMNKKDDA